MFDKLVVSGFYLIEAHVNKLLDLCIALRFTSLGAGIDISPMSSGLLVDVAVQLVLISNDRILRIVRFGRLQQRLQREQHRSQCHSCRPLVLEYVQAYGAGHAAYVRVPDLGEEFHFRWVEWICFGDFYLQLECSTFILLYNTIINTSRQ